MGDMSEAHCSRGLTMCRYPAYHNISPYSVAAASSMNRLAMRTTPGLASIQNSIFASAEITNGAASVAAR